MKKTMRRYNILSNGDLEIDGIERMIVTPEMFKEITAELAGSEVAELLNQDLEADLFIAVAEDGLMTGRYYQDKPPVEIMVGSKDFIGFYMDASRSGALVFYDKDAGQLISVLTFNSPGSLSPYKSGCINHRSLDHFDADYIASFPEMALGDIISDMFGFPIYIESHVVAKETERDLQLKKNLMDYIIERIGGSRVGDNWEKIWAENGEKIMETE